ncbi:MAG TPA: hypothetical protein VFX96_13785 [Pyrinomonadaceae bacterium]|nr:hypothetical protein [Pyrinomonadaceae bacterium]
MAGERIVEITGDPVTDSPLPEDVLQALTIGTVNSIGGQTASLSNLEYSNLIQNTNLTQQNTAANQQALNEVGVATLGKAVNLVANVSPTEAASITQLFTGNTVAEEIADLQAAVGPQPTKPPTSPPTTPPTTPPSTPPTPPTAPTVTLNPSGKGSKLTVTDSRYLPLEVVVNT